MMSKPFKYPVLIPFRKNVYVIPYSSVVGANANLTLLSNSLGFNLEVLAVKMFFDNDHLYNVLHYWIVSSNPSVSVTGVCSGTNIYGRFTPLPYFVGNDEVRTSVSGFRRTARRTFLKLHITNNNGFAVNVSGEAYIREIE